MILVLEKGIRAKQKDAILRVLKTEGVSALEFAEGGRTMLSLKVKAGQDTRAIEALPGIAKIMTLPTAMRLVAHADGREPTIVRVGDVEVGGENIVVIAGPCAIESREQALAIAAEVRKYGAVLFRGGAFKPRSSPYSFQGLGEEGLKILAEVRAKTGLPVVSEITSPSHARLMARYVDVLQVGARNMQNFELLKCVGRLRNPVLLKRGLSATIEEWLMSAEYVLSEGNSQVMLCERGIRTFEPYTRNTLDVSAIPVVKRLTHLPVIADPSHATGIREKVSPMARAAVAAGADGLMIEVHNEPDKARSDGAQSLLPEQFGSLMRDIYVIAPVIGKQLDFDYLEKRRTIARRAPRAKRRKPKAVYFGRIGTYSHKACVQFFGPKVAAQAAPSYQRIFEQVKSGEADFGVIPLESSLTGSVHQTYNLLLEYDLRIVGDITLRIIYDLIGHPGTTVSTVKRVYSHPEVFQQCREFIERQGWELVATQDAATAVKTVKARRGRTAAAVAPREAAAAYRMAVLERGIETNPRNYTRFGIIGAKPLTKGPRRKSTLIYATEDRPGALLETLQVFAAGGINLVKLESRPIDGKPWEYMFYVDLEADAESKAFRPVLEALRAKTDFLKILGCY